MDESNWDLLPDAEEAEQIKEKMADDPAAAAKMIQEYVEKKFNAPLNIGITGESGSGKSTFVNSFRGIKSHEEGSAPTGCVETTIEVKSYPHPNYPNVVLWDLPGIGTTAFPAEKYLEHVGFERFDFFIIISADRFRQNDVKLAKEIQKMEKKFYFVRSKIDHNIRDEERSQKHFSALEMLRQIRENCIRGLEKAGFQCPKVFLLSSPDLHLYDFPSLHDVLEKELPARKSHALLLAMPNINLEVINNKKAAFQSKIKWWSAVSAAGAAAPIPGLSLAADLATIASVVKSYVTGFGLNVESLQRLAATPGVAHEELRGELQSPLAVQEITQDVIVKVLTQVNSTLALITAEEGTRFIPLLGIPVAMGISFGMTYRALSYFLNSLAEDAQRVFKKSLRSL